MLQITHVLATIYHIPIICGQLIRRNQKQGRVGFICSDFLAHTALFTTHFRTEMHRYIHKIHNGTHVTGFVSRLFSFFFSCNAYKNCAKIQKVKTN